MGRITTRWRRIPLSDRRVGSDGRRHLSGRAATNRSRALQPWSPPAVGISISLTKAYPVSSDTSQQPTRRRMPLPQERGTRHCVAMPFSLKNGPWSRVTLLAVSCCGNVRWRIGASSIPEHLYCEARRPPFSGPWWRTVIVFLRPMDTEDRQPFWTRLPARSCERSKAPMASTKSFSPTARCICAFAATRSPEPLRPILIPVGSCGSTRRRRTKNTTLCP